MKTLRVYIVTRILLTIPMLFILVTLVFFVVRIMPGDPVEAMLRPGVPQEYKDQIKHNLGLDKPLFLNFRGSTARVEAEQLFLLTAPGSAGEMALVVEKDLVMAVGGRVQPEDQLPGEPDDWLQVVIPEGFVGMVSPDQMGWMRQVNTEMTVLGEEVIPGTETWAKFSAPEGPPGTEVNAIWGWESGVLWFGTDEGVTRYSVAGWELFEETAGKDILCVWSSGPAGIWFGTDGQGLLRFRGSDWSTLTVADGLASDSILSVWGQGSRTVWVGTDRGASRFNGRSWSTTTVDDGLAGNEVRAIWGDGKDTFWFGTEAGLSRFDGEEWTTFTADDGLPSNQVRALWGDEEDGTVWVGTEGGLGRFDGEAWTTYTTDDGLVSQRINVLLSAEDGKLWVGTDEGASLYDGQTWTSYSSADGLAADSVSSVWQDVSGNLWLGTVQGLNRFDNRPWVKLSVPDGGMEGWAPVEQFQVRTKPFDSQYFNYLWDLLRLDLGESLAPTRGRPVIEDLKLKFPATLELAIASLTITILIGVPTGAIAARHRRSAADFGFRVFSIVIWAVPVFWLGLMFQLVFGVYLGNWYEGSKLAAWYVESPVGQGLGPILPLPISGRIATEMAPRTITHIYVIDSIVTGNWKALVSSLRYLALPAFTLGLYLSGVFTRLTRSNMLDVLREDFITAGRARGVKERTVVYKHALKNAFIPILTMMGLQFAALLAGAVLTETTFSWPGMGLFMWERIGYRDFNSIQGSVVFFAVLVTAVSLVVDIIYAWIDPRIRY